MDIPDIYGLFGIPTGNQVQKNGAGYPLQFRQKTKRLVVGVVKLEVAEGSWEVVRSRHNTVSKGNGVMEGDVKLEMEQKKEQEEGTLLPRFASYCLKISE